MLHCYSVDYTVRSADRWQTNTRVGSLRPLKFEHTFHRFLYLTVHYGKKDKMDAIPLKTSKNNPEYAFGGPVGVTGIIVGLPLFVLFLITYITPDVHDILGNAFSFRSLLWVAGWFAFQAIFYLLPFGKIVNGLPLKTGKKLQYRCNAFIAFIATIIVSAILCWFYSFPLHEIFSNIIPLYVSTVIGVGLLSLYLYRRSLGKADVELSIHGTSGNPLYDFFMGRELNPRSGFFDWKFVCELRPGLIGWVILDLSMLAWEYNTSGTVSLAPVILTVYHAWYVGDALWFEPAVLSTKDIIEEGFGFMLAFGDLAWVPFFYSSQTQYLVRLRPQVSLWVILLSIGFHVVGYRIFRQSNLQKNIFRGNPKDVRLEGFRTIPTSVPGKDLLCGGWWCFVRHPNYLGDLLMTVGWTIVCGFGSLYPMVYYVYMFTLLIHREIRDEQTCRKKYGDAWNQYCIKVPWRIFPLIF
ncbi:delta(14)-sterol reductase TM7SF2-like isoform X2 [Paramacrobiotus metropolitanus]|uniref:delta(14)-sterol reductase TM7SF2-like isoform X2 n=1 Tax=Paramacrobiotus metropolitanus TaxID=2943436 RepID=UPI0024460076|nr:delta(14)-sterol reductase TM7SF2-like isoform X2 [Paramacrobiotus metropolitanus]